MPLLPCNQSLATFATITKPIMRVSRSGRLVAATYAQELNTAGATATVKIRNLTRAVDMSAALDVNGKGALYGTDFVVNTDGSADCAKGDLLGVVFTFGTGSAGPGEFTVLLDVQYGQMNDSGIA